MYNLHDHGFQVFKGIFMANEVERMRTKIKELFDRLSQKNLILERKSKDFNFKSLIPDVIQEELAEFNYIIFDERILNCVRNLIGTDIVYFQDSTIQIGTGLTGYHKDNKTDNNPEDSDWKTSYDVIRMGVYFQNTQDFSGGINIKIGSHNYPNYYSGRSINVPLETGDVVFWKLTTTHSGNAKRLKFLPNISFPGRIQRILPESFFLPEEMERIALFACFGRPGIHLDSYVNYFQQKSDTPIRLNNSSFSKLSQSLAVANRVSLESILK